MSVIERKPRTEFSLKGMFLQSLFRALSLNLALIALRLKKTI